MLKTPTLVGKGAVFIAYKLLGIFSEKVSSDLLFSCYKMKSEKRESAWEKNIALDRPRVSGSRRFHRSKTMFFDTVSNISFMYRYRNHLPALFLPRPFKFAEALRARVLEGVAPLKNR